MTSLSSLARLAAVSPGRKLFVPENGRRPIMTDEPVVIMKRQYLAKRMRFILYGQKDVDCPSHRLVTWAFLVREFVRLRDFRYVELLHEARRFVKTLGHVDTESYDESLDLDLLKAFQQYLYKRREELGTWRNREATRDPSIVLEETSVREAKTLVLEGTCPVCGDELPCTQDGIPRYEKDGKGGIRAVS